MVELVLPVDWLGTVGPGTKRLKFHIPSPVATKDKGKVVMQESEQPKKIKKRVQIQMSIDEELAQKLHEEEQARFNVEQEAKKQSLMKNKNPKRLDYEAAMRIQEELDESERQRIAQKLFAQQRPEAKRNKPMNPTQHKAYMSTYIKNQEGGYSIKKLKVKEKELKDKRLEKLQVSSRNNQIERHKIGEASGLEEPAKRQKIGEASGLVQEQSDEEPKIDELSQEQLQQMMIIVQKKE
ncbi:hypothetical protein Tco_0706809 [Tanacetum coccineum]|uniref:Uncharacterized protein n=1 Tax=Tanacetum coccineum TaxID=301880 RepID=A0ABQ4YAK9_9ASTR